MFVTVLAITIMIIFMSVIVMVLSRTLPVFRKEQKSDSENHTLFPETTSNATPELLHKLTDYELDKILEERKNIHNTYSSLFYKARDWYDKSGEQLRDVQAEIIRRDPSNYKDIGTD